MSVRWVLLPGMDGIGCFRTFREALGETADCKPLSYPTDTPLDYDELTHRVRQAIRAERDYILIAESFSGPIAIRLAAERPPGLRAVVLAASFCCSPVTGLTRSALLAGSGLMFRLPPPHWMVEYFLLDHQAPQALFDDLHRSLHQVRAAVLGCRLREILAVDACAELRQVSVPLLYLQATVDQLVGERAARAVMAAAPHCELHQIDAPHMILQRRPHESIAAIRGFLSEHKIC